MQRAINVIFNYPSDRKNATKEELEYLGFRVNAFHNESYSERDYVKSHGRLIYLWKYIWISHRAVRQTEEGDIIVGMQFTLGLIVALIAALCGKNRKVLALNLIAYERSRLDFIKIPLFRFAFLQIGLKSTVNSIRLIDTYDKKFRLNGRQIFSLLNDSYDPYEYSSLDFGSQKMNPSEKFCFSGGEANRDWSTLLDAARSCSKINFKIVAREYMWDKSLDVPRNVKVLFDESVEGFYSNVQHSHFVIVTLSSDVVAGLRVFIQAIKMKKFVIITDTSSVRQYIPEGCENIVVRMGDPSDLAQKIMHFYSNEEQQDEIITKLHANLVANFSQKYYASRIVGILEENEFIISPKNSSGLNEGIVASGV